MRNLKSGISLLEVVIAIQCTAILLALLCRVLPLARRQVREADQTLGSALAAHNVLEQYLPVAPREWPAEPIAVADTHYSVSLEAAPYEQDNNILLARATVWLGSEKTYVLETLVHP